MFLETREDLLSQIAALRAGVWDVRLLHTTLNIDPNGLAVVWAKYGFYSDGRPNHCGFEATRWCAHRRVGRSSTSPIPTRHCRVVV
jgi:hypothetical protein